MADNFDQDLNAQELRKQEFRSRYKGSKDLVKLAKIMKAVQETRDRLKEELAMANDELDVIRIEVIPALMEEKGIENFKVEGLGRVSLTADMFVHVKPGAKNELFAWLRKRKLGDLITMQLNSSTLKSFVKGRIKDGKEVPGEYVNVTPYTRASITKG